ncbi:hypothetical protein GCM10010129_68400 [Streptomyces fumigatiscleroticus]|nr:hypothetical protein GCM10010129_68400 [Streptomyces fumigatiscleroticus]
MDGGHAADEGHGSASVATAALTVTATRGEQVDGCDLGGLLVEDPPPRRPVSHKAPSKGPRTNGRTALGAAALRTSAGGGSRGLPRRPSARHSAVVSVDPDEGGVDQVLGEEPAL